MIEEESLVHINERREKESQRDKIEKKEKKIDARK